MDWVPVDPLKTVDLSLVLPLTEYMYKNCIETTLTPLLSSVMNCLLLMHVIAWDIVDKRM